jgi:hypothetical protein
MLGSRYWMGSFVMLIGLRVEEEDDAVVVTGKTIVK